MTKLAFGMGGVSPEVAHGELERIRQARGLTASAVVEESKPKDAPLHPAFEWNDKKAAAEHRLWQARQIIRAVHVVHEDGGKREPVYVHLPAAKVEGDEEQPKEGRYERVDVVVQSPDLFAQALGELRTKMRAAIDAAEGLERAAKGSDDSDRLVKVGLAIKALETASSAIAAMH